MKRLYLLLFATCVFGVTYAQTSVSSSGGNGSNKDGYQQSFSIGQNVVDTYVNDDASAQVLLQ